MDIGGNFVKQRVGYCIIDGKRVATCQDYAIFYLSNLGDQLITKLRFKHAGLSIVLWRQVFQAGRSVVSFCYKSLDLIRWLYLCIKVHLGKQRAHRAERF